ncbi:MAG: SpoIIE family protein phosphatase, partial [Bacteroidia bacterium]|nr:SpoIIE family protein phosphatase [Bacteroidia bacterium]
KNKKLFYSGANRPLFIVEKDSETLTEIKATKLPVGGGQYETNREYQLHTIELNKNMVAYLCTDGYADQFGGPKRKKYLSTQLQKNFKEISKLSPSGQKKKLDENYMEWKGSLEQIDDVCIIGINFDTA